MLRWVSSPWLPCRKFPEGPRRRSIWPSTSTTIRSVFSLVSPRKSCGLWYCMALRLRPRPMMALSSEETLTRAVVGADKGGCRGDAHSRMISRRAMAASAPCSSVMGAALSIGACSSGVYRRTRGYPLPHHQPGGLAVRTVAAPPFRSVAALRVAILAASWGSEFS